jgi:hypothetical protein
VAFVPEIWGYLANVFGLCNACMVAWGYYFIPPKQLKKQGVRLANAQKEM